MKQLSLLIALLIQLVWTPFAAAQPYHTQSLTFDDGLSHGYITALFQDSRGFVWIGTLYGLNRYDGYQIKSFLPNLLDTWSLHATTITCITEDHQGLIWLGTDKGLAVFNPYSETFLQLADVFPKSPTGFVRDILTDDNNNIWCNSTQNDTNFLYKVHFSPSLAAYLDTYTKDIPQLKIQKVSVPGGSVRLFIKTSATTCLLANATGSFSLDLSTANITPIPLPTASLIPGLSTSTLLFPDNNYADPFAVHERTALLSHSGAKESYLFRFFDKNIYALPNNKIIRQAQEVDRLPVIATIDQPQSIARMVDNNGKIWIGTIGNGVRILEPIPAAFDHLHPDISFANPSYMPGNHLWAGMFAHDKMINLNSGQVLSPPWAGSLSPDETVNAAYFDSLSRNIYLILSRNNAEQTLAQFHLPNQQLKRLKRLAYINPGPTILHLDSRANLWIAGSGGELLRYHPASGIIQHWNLSYLFPAKDNFRRDMPRWATEDTKARIWIAGDAGIICIDPNTPKPSFKAYHNNGLNGPIFKNNFIFSIYPDPDSAHILWLGTLSDGFARFNLSTGQTSYVSTMNNQPFNMVSGIIPDKSGNLWLSTDKGIFHFLTKDQVFINYSTLKHIPKLTINAAATLIIPSGDILFGSNNGIIRVNPASITPDTRKYQLLLSDVNVNRQPASSGILSKKILLGKDRQYELHLAHNDRFISLKFTIPESANPESVQYRYRLQGLYEDWIYLGRERSIAFTELQPGSFLLEVQAIESFDSWNEALRLLIPITVSPPWYFSKIAWFFYAVLLISAVWAAFRYERKRLSLQYKADLSHQEMVRLQSMDSFKNRFFAYIAHEFKTPLNIIMGAGYKLRTLHAPTTAAYPDAILREGNNMLYLINELIDVTRLQDKSIHLNYEHRDLISLIKKTTSAHIPLLEINQIQLRMDLPNDKLFMDLDPLRTQYIINNIISNAIRYTPAGGHITVALKPTDHNHIQMAISDNGAGIPPEKLPHIFDRYFQAYDDVNTYHNFGLGLSFVKELAELLRAQISVTSTPGHGTTFFVSLPIHAPQHVRVKELDETDERYTRSDIFIADTFADPDAPTLLIVDDHPTIQSYLKSILQPHFQLLMAKNGREGIDIATAEIPDLILTDVMMPVLNGIEMTARLKAQTITCHIPIIILSAKNEIQDRLQGQQYGADLYIGKPFHEQELILALMNLYRLQQHWKTRYAPVLSGSANLQDTLSLPATFSPNSIAQNDVFMQQILDAFEANYSSIHFDAVELAAILNISKAQLYRKIAKISGDGEGAMGMLRVFRLNKALDLLRNHPNMSTKHIAYKIGFKEYSHFSYSFKRQFNVSPAEWRKQYR